MKDKRVELIINAVDINLKHHIFDTCCDSGLIGISLIKHKKDLENFPINLTFIDHSIFGISELKKNLHKLNHQDYLHQNFPHLKIQVEAQDVKKFIFPTQIPSAIIIAGVGGYLIIEILKENLSLSPNHQMLLMAHSHLEALKSYLSKDSLNKYIIQSEYETTYNQKSYSLLVVNLTY